MHTTGIICVLFVSSSFAADEIISPARAQPALQESNAVRLDSGDFSPTSQEPSLPIEGGAARQSNYNLFGSFGGSNRRRCPYCDRTVYPYCSEKLFHDACCCTDPYQFPLPHKCHFADCAFLHANSCTEHRLISNCCCSDEYRSLLRGIGKSDAAAVVAVGTEGKN